MSTNRTDFCTCADRECPLHPANHDKGCTPCMKKNLRAGEVPSCLWNLVSTREERQREGCDYRIASFAEMVRRKAPDPSPPPATALRRGIPRQKN